MLAQAVHDAEELAALAPEWWELWRRSTTSTPFDSPAWLIPWWRHFAPGRLFVITVRDGGRLVGLAPFYIEAGALQRRVLPIGISLSDYHDVLVDPAEADVAGQALVDCLAARAGAWDSWHLEEVRPEAAALRLPAPADAREERSPQSACPVLSLPCSNDELLNRLSRKKRATLRGARNRAGRRRMETLLATIDTAPQILDDLFCLHGRRWSDQGEPGVLASEQVRRFHRDALPELLSAGLLCLHELRLDGAPAAVLYCMQHRDRSYGYLTGINPDFMFESPGALVVLHAIEHAIENGASEFHFLRGREAYKYTWGAVDRWNQRRSFQRSISHG